MTVPGSNILTRAMRLLRRTTVQYYQFSGRVTNDYGVDVPTYVPPVDITGSLQAVPQNYYAALGLDFQKSYVTFYCERGLLDIQRDSSGDIIQFGTRIYSVESITDWLNIDGWVSALCVLTDGAAPDPLTYVVTPGTVFIVEPV